MKDKVVVIIIAAVVALGVGAGAFLLGMRVGAGRQTALGPGGAGFPGGPGGPSGQFRRGTMGGSGGLPQGGFRSGPDGGAFVAGKVIEKDKGSITVSVPQGGSKTVYLSGSTRFERISRGSAADVSVGETVTAVGNTDAGGAVTARAVTIVKR